MKLRVGESRGFTIVELLIVIVVIAILAAITIVSYNGIMAQARNADRVSDMSSLQKALEIYYVENGVYPAQRHIAETDGNDGFITDVLMLPRDTVINPSASSGTINSITNGGDYNDTPTLKYFYRASQADGSNNCWAPPSQVCKGYIIVYRLEGATSDTVVYGGNYPR